MYVFEATSFVSRFIAESLVALLIVYFVLGLDSLFFDVLYWAYAARQFVKRMIYQHVTKAELVAKPQKRIAIFIACWHEAGVIDRMLRRACSTIEYSNYDFFVGCYPNDVETIECVEAVSHEFPQVHAIINPQPGPTTKTQNLNAVFNGMRFHERMDWYEIIVMHDAEDIVHPLSLLVYNYLIPRKNMVQIPVFPLEIDVRRMVGWTYADEFAEHQLKDIVLREAIGSFVPSAGVGCGFDRRALERISHSRKQLFPSKTLTEDYEIGLRLSLAGFKTIHAQIRVLDETGAKSYVATRGYFPTTQSTAVRQKARWLAGICLQSWETLGWPGGLVTLYALYRDRKGLIANPLTIVGYGLLLASIGMYGLNAIDPTVAVPTVNLHMPFVRIIFESVMAMTIFRLVQRAYFVGSLYGPLQAILSILRQPLGAIINALATVRAMSLFAKARVRREEMSWQKTSHEFPQDAAA